MYGSVVAVVLLVALTGRCADSNALPSIEPKDVFWALQDSDTPAQIEPEDVLLALQDSNTLAPVQPKGPNCQQFPVSVSVPAGESVTFSSPSSSLPEMCWWDFSTVPGSTLNLKCSTFDMQGDSFVIYSSLECQPLTYLFTGGDFPTNLPIPAETVSMLFVHVQQSSLGVFACNITASGTTTPTTSAKTTITTTRKTTITTTRKTTTAPQKNCRCGIVNRTPRIMGGVNTQVNEYPWQVGILDGKTRSVFCGGSIISNRYIATAAHCMKGKKISSFKLLLGGHTTNSPITTEKIVNPIKIINHPQYQVGNSNNNDISIIEIAPLNFADPNEVSRPICLPDSSETYAGVTATTTGWGTLSSGGSQPDILQEVDLLVVTNAVCTSVYGSLITDNMICAGTVAGGKDSCQGDSGGPLIAPDGANYELIGIVSFGSGCGIPNVPGGYVRVTALKSWIQSTIIGSTTCGR